MKPTLLRCVTTFFKLQTKTKHHDSHDPPPPPSLDPPLKMADWFVSAYTPRTRCALCSSWSRTRCSRLNPPTPSLLTCCDRSWNCRLRTTNSSSTGLSCTCSAHCHYFLISCSSNLKCWGSCEINLQKSRGYSGSLLLVQNQGGGGGLWRLL